MIQLKSQMLLLMTAFLLNATIGKQSTNLYQSTARSLSQKADSCSDQTINVTNSCHQDVTPNTIIDRMANDNRPNRDGLNSEIPEDLLPEAKNERDIEKNKGGSKNADSSKTTPMSLRDIFNAKTVIAAPAFEELESQNEQKVSLVNLNGEILLDKRSPINAENSQEGSTETNDVNSPKPNEADSHSIEQPSEVQTTRDGKSAKLEKSNELITDNVAEDTSLPTSSDVKANERDTLKVNIVTEDITEEPGTTMVFTEAAPRGEAENVTVTTPVLVMTEDDGGLKHNIAGIPRNTITKVDVKDCPCDVIKHVCDINCCCDNDCSAYDRAVFSHCLPLPSSSSSQYCFSKQLIYIKNAPFYVSKSPDNSLLCIETENLKSTTNFTSLKPIASTRSFTKVIERRKHHKWSRAVLQTPSIYSLNRLPHNQSYKAGQPIWMLNSTDVKVFDLPSHSILSDSCTTQQPVNYLQDSQAECVVQLNECSPDGVLSSTVYYRNFFLLASTSFENFTVNCTRRSCLSVEPYVCQGAERSTCSPMVTDHPPLWDAESRVCANVTQSIHYLMKHNGTRGLVTVKLYLRLTNASMGETVRIKSKVSFEWYSRSEHSLHRSGNPGYRAHAPLISGTRLIFNLSQEDQTIPSIKFSSSPQDWITMLSFNNKGECNRSDRRNLLFGINEQVACSFLFSQKQFTDCDAIQDHIYRLLLGNIKPWETDVYIGSTGDPNIFSIDDWVPILWSKAVDHSTIPSLPCGHLITGVNVRILTAFAGEFSNPEPRIIGTLIESYKHSTQACVGLKCKVTLAWSVSFVQMRNSRFTKFPEPPVYEIKLPSNFFYPFLSSANRGDRAAVVYVLCLMTSILAHRKTC